ncbi:MAG: glycosyltransferase [Planctomycetota bacterium]|nr:glycosyltransferase [Planctomycetota bacterium]
MRILMVTSYPLAGQYDGTAMLSKQILWGLQRRGLVVAHAYLNLRQPFRRVHRGDFDGSPSYTLPAHAWVRGLNQIRRDHPFDLVHAEHYGGATRSYFACRRFGWPMVYHVHSLLGDEVERSRLGRGPVFRWNVAIEKRVCATAAGVVVLGELNKRVMVEEKGVPADRVSVIHPGLDLSPYRQSGPPTQIPGIKPDDQVIMYIGNIMHPNQGVPILIEALTRIFAARPQARCVLVGGPVEAGEAYRVRLGEFGDRLIVLPGQTPEQIVGLARRADVLVHPRLACRENYSVQTKIAVYLASGRPIVATDFGDYQRLLGETGAGLLTPVAPEPLADGILRVLSDPDLAGRLAAAARPVAEEHFGMDRNVDRYLDVYEKAMSAGPR